MICMSGVSWLWGQPHLGQHAHWRFRSSSCYIVSTPVCSTGRCAVLYVDCVLCPLVGSFIFPCHTRACLGCTCCKPVSDDARHSSLQVRVNYTSISEAFIIAEWNMTSEDPFQKDTPNLFMYTLRVCYNNEAHITVLPDCTSQV